MNVSLYGGRHIEDGKPLEQSVVKRADGSTILIFITELFVHENHNDK